MPVRLGVVGADDKTLRQCKAFAENDAVRIVAVCDADAARAQTVAKRFNASAFKDARRLLDSENLDALYVGSDLSVRRGADILAVARGCSVLLPMPLAANRKALQDLTRAAREHRALVCPILPLRYARLVQSLQKMLKTRGGQPIAVSGTVWCESATAENKKRSASPLFVLSTHIIDLLRYCCGEVRAVTACGQNLEKAAAWTLQFQNGLLATLSLAHSELNSGCCIEVLTNAARHRLTLEVHDHRWYQNLTSHLSDGELRRWTHDEDATQEMNGAILVAITSGRRAGLQSTLADAAKTWAVLDAAQRAMKTQKTTRVTE